MYDKLDKERRRRRRRENRIFPNPRDLQKKQTRASNKTK
jgi:hypothetical protein